MSRPTKYNPSITDEICKALRMGNTRKAACAYARISEDSFARWFANNADFADAIKKAEADAEVHTVATLKQAMAESWQAAAWWLERRRPQEWGRKDVVTLLTKFAKMDDSELDAYITAGLSQAGLSDADRPGPAALQAAGDE